MNLLQLAEAYQFLKENQPLDQHLIDVLEAINDDEQELEIYVRLCEMGWHTPRDFKKLTRLKTNRVSDIRIKNKKS